MSAVTTEQKLREWGCGVRVFAVIDDVGADWHGQKELGTVVDVQSGWLSGIPSAKVEWDDTGETHWTNLDRLTEVTS